MSLNIIYNKLFEYRLNLLDDDNIDELYIIKELKYYLLDNDFDEDTINETLYDFYKMFDIYIELSMIEQVTIDSIHNVPQMINLDQIFSFPSMNNINMYNPGNGLFFNQLDPNPNAIFQELFSMLVNNELQEIIPPLQPLGNVVVTTDENDIKKLQTKKLDEKLESKCSICMDSMDKDHVVTILNCDHTFHQECIETLMKEYSNKCPLCRKDIGVGYANV